MGIKRYKPEEIVTKLRQIEFSQLYRCDAATKEEGDK